MKCWVSASSPGPGNQRPWGAGSVCSAFSQEDTGECRACACLWTVLTAQGSGAGCSASHHLGRGRKRGSWSQAHRVLVSSWPHCSCEPTRGAALPASLCSPEVSMEAGEASGLNWNPLCKRNSQACPCHHAYVQTIPLLPDPIPKQTHTNRRTSHVLAKALTFPGLKPSLPEASPHVALGWQGGWTDGWTGPGLLLRPTVGPRGPAGLGKHLSALPKPLLSHADQGCPSSHSTSGGLCHRLRLEPLHL